jgi:hypothetical protein
MVRLGSKPVKLRMGKCFPVCPRNRTSDLRVNGVRTTSRSASRSASAVTARSRAPRSARIISSGAGPQRNSHAPHAARQTRARMRVLSRSFRPVAHSAETGDSVALVRRQRAAQRVRQWVRQTRAGVLSVRLKNAAGGGRRHLEIGISRAAFNARRRSSAALPCCHDLDQRHHMFRPSIQRLLHVAKVR